MTLEGEGLCADILSVEILINLGTVYKSNYSQGFLKLPWLLVLDYFKTPAGVLLLFYFFPTLSHVISNNELHSLTTSCPRTGSS